MAMYRLGAHTKKYIKKLHLFLCGYIVLYIDY